MIKSNTIFDIKFKHLTKKWPTKIDRLKEKNLI